MPRSQAECVVDVAPDPPERSQRHAAVQAIFARQRREEAPLKLPGLVEILADQCILLAQRLVRARELTFLPARGDHVANAGQ
jgi:hypothetical protein